MKEERSSQLYSSINFGALRLFPTNLALKSQDSNCSASSNDPSLCLTTPGVLVQFFTYMELKERSGNHIERKKITFKKLFILFT